MALPLLTRLSFLQIILCVNGHIGEYHSKNVYQQNHQYNPTQSPGVGIHGVPSDRQANLIRDKTRVQDKEHIKDHLDGVIEEPDLSKMTEEELQFHYFKLHDSDGNRKLDGCELVKSLIHWHLEESKQSGMKSSSQAPKIFSDGELSTMIDPILDMDDQNHDGYIDYPEFVAAQQSRGS